MAEQQQVQELQAKLEEHEEYRRVFSPEELAAYPLLELAWFFEGVKASKKMDDLITRRKQEKLLED